MRITVERRSPEHLTPYENNNKPHPPEHVEAIARSIRRFGFRDPIGILPDGTIVEGEGRWRAAVQLGLASVPVLVLHDMEERDADLYRIAHNTVCQMTGFSVPALCAALDRLLDTPVALGDVGFTESDVANLRNVESLMQGEVTVNPELVFTVQWDNPEQRRAWEKFVKKATKSTGMGSGEAVLAVAADAGLIDDLQG